MTHGQIDYIAHRLQIENVEQEPGEKRARAKGYDREVKSDPQPESEVVGKVGHAQSVAEREVGSVQPPDEERGRDQHERGEADKGAARRVFPGTRDGD